MPNKWQSASVTTQVTDTYTEKPVCNDHLYNEIHYLWFIQ